MYTGDNITSVQGLDEPNFQAQSVNTQTRLSQDALVIHGSANITRFKWMDNSCVVRTRAAIIRWQDSRSTTCTFLSF